MGHRWKEYHEALGLKSIVDFSWEMVQKEKHDMLHVLDFPYNGETRPQYLLGDGKLTQNRHHLYVRFLMPRVELVLNNLQYFCQRAQPWWCA